MTPLTPADEHRLREAYRRESRSLLQYAGQAELYAGGADRKVLDAVRRVAAEDAEHLRGFADILGQMRVAPPHPGAFPVGFTDLNFVAARWLLPKLAADRRRAAADLTADRDAVADPAAKAAFEALADMARRHLAELESLPS
ncbi:MAG: hypothetical protein K2X87_18035 [Gemmataceae bacterium]|nr:hypothetical protein [Gemmataceae bacterium]